MEAGGQEVAGRERDVVDGLEPARLVPGDDQAGLVLGGRDAAAGVGLDHHRTAPDVQPRQMAGQGAPDRRAIERGAHVGAQLLERAGGPFGLEPTAALGPLGVVTDQDVRLFEGRRGQRELRPLGDVAEHLAAQRRDRLVPGAHVAEILGPADHIVEGAEEEPAGGAVEVPAERVDQPRSPVARQRGVGAGAGRGGGLGPGDVVRRALLAPGRLRQLRLVAPGSAEAAARLPDLGQGVEHDVARAPRRVAAQLRQHEPHGLDPHLARRLPDRGQWGGGEAGLLDVVEADHGDVLGHAQAAEPQGLERAQRHPVVGRHDRVAASAAVEERGHRVLPRREPVVAGDDQLVVGRQAAVLVGGAVAGQTLLALTAEAGDERDPLQAVLLNQVLGEGADAAGVVDGDAGDARLGRADDAGRQRAQTLQQRADRRVALAGAHRPLDDDDGVEVPDAGQRVDEVARIGGRDDAARQNVEVDVARLALLVRADDDLVLIRVATAAQQETYAGPALVRAHAQWRAATALMQIRSS